MGQSGTFCLERMIIALVAALFTTPHTSAQEAATSRVFGGECTYRRVKSLAAKAEDEFITVKAPMEILNINVLIAAGEPHLHVTLSADKGTFGGHLEKGCRVLYRAEITIAKFSGPALVRKPNKAGIPMLQPK